MTSRIVSVSAALYDGYPFPDVLESLAACGVTHVEPAFIVGYTEAFDEGAFAVEPARQYARWLEESGLGCFAFSSHIDLGREDAVEVFRRRMDFAAALGARVINTNAAARTRREQFFRNLPALIRHAEVLDMRIGLENPGDGSDNLINTAEDGIVLLREIGSDRVGLNYDAANTASHRPEGRLGGVNPAEDAVRATPCCVHVHIKDLKITPEGYFFTPIGEGQIGCGRILRALAQSRINLSIEMPLRLSRDVRAQPVRRPTPVPRGELESALRQSLDYLHVQLENALSQNFVQEAS